MLGAIEGPGGGDDPEGDDGGSPAEAVGVTLVVGSLVTFADDELDGLTDAVVGADGSPAADVAAADVAAADVF